MCATILAIAMSTSLSRVACTVFTVHEANSIAGKGLQDMAYGEGISTRTTEAQTSLGQTNNEQCYRVSSQSSGTLSDNRSRLGELSKPSRSKPDSATFVDTSKTIQRVIVHLECE